MRVWMPSLLLCAALSSCGQNESRSVSQPDANEAPPLTCADDPSSASVTYRVTAYKGDAAFRRVTIERRAANQQPATEIIGDFSDYEDKTPVGPSDIDFSWRYADLSRADDGYAVTLTKGGFTGWTTASITKGSFSGSTPVAQLTCR